MNTADHLTEDDLALFALQLFSDEEQKPVVAHLEECEECRVKVAEVQGDLVAFAVTAELHSPPAAARDRLLKQVQREKKLVPIDRPLPQQQQLPVAEPMLASRNSLLFSEHIEEPTTRSSMGALGWAGWAVAASVAVFAGVQFHQQQKMELTVASLTTKLKAATPAEDAARAQEAMKTLTGAGAMQVSLRIPPPEGVKAPPAPEGHVAYVAESGSMVFIADHLTPLPAYKTYELWVLPANGHDPIAAGIFKPDGNGSANVVMPNLPKGVPASGFGVTIEDDGGSKTPTKPIILVGTV
ncbi:Anti-sigma-K factor rskA [Bryocella elongata]|uniref:Regulator of SigK n=1 Tax=Bryocella elongata TaxID=863522 RepID=A0A1H5U1H1_9BACT|nr:anti-sigma factor [Bryocella elongata]SEF68101.1 Anti-sigma-K factor rskA [Bryocella elongata]